MRRLILILLTLACAGSLLAQSEKPIAHLTKYRGSLSVVRDGAAKSVFPGVPLKDGDIVTTRRGSATITFLDGSEIKLRRNSKISVSQRGNRRDIEVFAGNLWSRVVSWKEGLTRFRTGTTIAAIRGTTIEWTVSPDETVGVGVESGRIELTDERAGLFVDLGAGLGMSVGFDPSGMLRLTLAGTNFTTLDVFVRGQRIRCPPGSSFGVTPTGEIIVESGNPQSLGAGEPDTSPTPTPEPDESPTPTPEETPESTPRPTPTPWPTATPSPSPRPTPRPTLAPVVSCGECGIPDGRGGCNYSDSLCPDLACTKNRVCKSGHCVGGTRVTSKEDPNCI
jgi:hypothetical protein